jgi:xylan 1,4-beta-xylosidase
MVSGDPAYEIEVDVNFDTGVQAGFLLFYSDRLYAGIGINDKSLMLHRYGLDQRHIPKPEGMTHQLRIRLVHAWHVLTIYTSHDGGRHWQKFPVQMDVSGYHHNVAYGFMSLRPALYATGKGEARFQKLTYRALA